MNSSRETLKGGFSCPKCCWNATTRRHFCIGLLLLMKNGSITTTPSAKNHMGNPANQLCIWWDQKGVLYYELLKPGETINGERYRTQLIRLKRAIAKKRPEYATRHEAIIFHLDNARPHVAIPVKNYLENSGWEVLPHPPYSPGLASSDYHLFRSMQNALTGIRFTSEQGIKNWLDSFLQPCHCY